MRSAIASLPYPEAFSGPDRDELRARHPSGNGFSIVSRCDATISANGTRDRSLSGRRRRDAFLAEIEEPPLVNFVAAAGPVVA